MAEFGSGLTGSFFGAPAPEAPVSQPPVTAAPAPEGPLRAFGQGLNRLMNGPNYTAPDPQATPLDQTADTLQQRITRANDVATNPLLQVFNPEGVAKARAFIPQATEQLQKIRAQKAAMQANRIEGQTLGLAPGEVADEATRADRVAVAQAKALRGDLRAFKGIQAVEPKAAEAIQDQVYNAVGGHLDKAQLAFDNLAGMQNQGQYEAKLNQLRKDGVLADLEAMGLKVPASFDAFSNGKGIAAQTLREARMGLNDIRRKLEERNTFMPMDEKEAGTYKGRLTTAFGDQITNGSWSRNAASGTRGMVINGMANPNDLGRTFTLASPEQRKAIKEEIELAVPKGDMEKYRALNRVHALAEPTEAQRKRGDVINTNPNVLQGVSEGFAGLLRLGDGGANVGLLNIEAAKRGAVQGVIDALQANYAGAMNTITGEQIRPYLSKLTQQQQRDVLDGLKQWSDASIGDRAAAIAQRAGALGLDAAALGLGGKEAAGVVQNALEAGRRAQIERMSPHHQAIGGGDGVLQLGAQLPGAGAVAPPAGTTPSTQLPGAPLQTPVQQQQNLAPPGQPPAPGGSPPPPSPVVGSPGQPGGGTPFPAAQPRTIAGQVVNPQMPPGAGPDYVAKMQRIESGNERDPWRAGAKGSSASGAFQFINSTWAANKPQGAPARAADATPEQQAAALATFTAKNAAALQNNRLPVNDTTLYVAHNLGAGGASALLSAPPTADARAIVGEAAARNNPLFFKGRPTVATVLQRYQNEMDRVPDGSGSKPQPSSGGAAASIFDRLTGRAPGQVVQLPGSIQGDHVATPEERANSPVVDFAPAIGSTVGAVAGSVGGPLGTVAGGAAGGAAGQSFKDWMQGRDQSPAAIAKEAALGGVLGVMPAGRPIVGAAARVLGVGGVEAGAAALEGKDAPDVADTAAKGAAYALGGEALGRFIGYAGPAAHKVISNYTDTAKAALSEQAGKLAEARKVIEAEPPKLPGADGASVPNPKYDAAKADAEKATAYLKDHGQNPDDMVYAYNSAQSGTSAGEAATMRKAVAEKAEVSAGYEKLRQGMKETGVGKVRANQAVPNGPLAQIRTAENPTGKVPEAFRADAEHAEMLIKAPAEGGWGEKWQQLQNAGTELIDKRMAFLANADKPSAKAMDALFEGVRNQQKAAAEYVFGPERGRQVIRTLENLDRRYAQIMTATQGLKYEKMQSVLASGNTPAARELEANFKAFAKDDATAIRAFNVLKASARGDLKKTAALAAPFAAAEMMMHGVPVLSGTFIAAKVYQSLKNYMNARVLGKDVTFKDFLKQEMNAPGPGVAGQGVQRAAVM